MKNINKITLILISFFFFNNEVLAENKIVYVDIEQVLSVSEVGQKAKKELDLLHKKNIEKFQKIQIKLQEDEKTIVAQKNLLKQDEFDKKIQNLRTDIQKFREDRNKAIEDINKKRNNFNKMFIENLNPILANYSKDNSLDMIIQKKNIVIGKSELDISSEILKIVNQKIKKIKLD